MNRQLIKILKNISLLLELKGENPFKSRAYTNAAAIIEDEGIDIEKAVRENTLSEIKGFGKALQSKVTDFVKNGKMEYYEKLKAEVPDGLVAISRIGGIGPKKARMLYYDNDISSIDILEEYCLNDKLKNIKGFGAKSQEQIMNSIQHRKASKGRYIQQFALEGAEKVLAELKKKSGIKKAEIGGKVRRKGETISEINFITSGTGTSIENSDPIFSKIEIPVRVENVHQDEFAVRLHNSSCSKEYLEAFNRYVNENGFSLENDRLIRNREIIDTPDEESIYSALGIQFVPPELREKSATFDKAVKHDIPELISEDDLKGMLHCHSTWSDGRNSIREMALASKDLGFEYFAICDHSRSAAYANGLSIDRVKLQHAEIDKLNTEDIGIPIIKGIESDILADGSLDYPEEVLESFDMVVASVHSSFRMSKEDMTRRMICAIKSPYTTMLGHPSGRLLLVRPAYEVDVFSLIDAASDYGKIIEINSNPYRLDLSWEYLQYAVEKGMKVAINPDSHKTNTLSDVFIGVNIARKGLLEVKDVVNCLDFNTFKKQVLNKD